MGVDDHVAELAGEPVGTHDQPPGGDDAPADARAQRHHHQVVDAAPGADGPLGERGAGGVVADRDPPAEPLGEAAGDVELDHIGDVRRRLQHAVERDQPGEPDTDGLDGAGVGLEVADDRGEDVDQRIATARRGLTGLGEERTVGVDDDTEALRAADVDAEVPGGHPPAQLSARVLSSRTEFRMRTSARRLTKPGSGAASSIARS